MLGASEAIAYIAFLMASAGAAAMVKVFVSRTNALRNTWINREPFSCPLCMGFWFGTGISYWRGYGVWESVVAGASAAAFSWFFYWKVTGEN